MERWRSGRLSEAARLAALLLVSWGTAAAQDFAGREKLRAHGAQEFRKDVVKVTDGVYVAVGYSMANATLNHTGGASVFAGTVAQFLLRDLPPH